MMNATYTRSVVHPEPFSFWLFLRDSQPPSSPDSLHTLVDHIAARSSKKRGDSSVPVTSILARQLDDGPCQRVLIISHLRNVLLRRSVLSEDVTRSPLGHPETFRHSSDAPTVAFEAQKFPLAASWRIILSSVRSETALRSREFSFFNSLSRFAWLTFIPPYSFLQRSRSPHGCQAPTTSGTFIP